MILIRKKYRVPMLLAVFMVVVPMLAAGPPETGKSSEAVPVSPELREKAQQALIRGGAYLIQNQATDGSWRNFAAITALCAVALDKCPPSDNELARRIAIEKAHQRILASVQPDGAICPPNRMFANYSTSVCLAALAILDKAEDADIIHGARQYLLGQQSGSGQPGQPVDEDSSTYGGFGYGGAVGPAGPDTGGKGGNSRNGTGRPGRGPEDHADLSCTQWALEALHVVDSLAREKQQLSDQDTAEAELAWRRARIFLEKVQNLKKTGDGGWLVTDDNDGGFRYLPVAEGEDLASYGSMTYAGLKSMIYAELQRDDPRVVAALNWAKTHYTVDENPGKGINGHYYYLLTMTKALSAFGSEELVCPDGRSHQWRTDVVQKLVDMQGSEGQWLNEHSGRWQENDPQLVTAYAMIALEIALTLL